MKNLHSLSLEEMQEEMGEQARLSERLGDLLAELELYNHPSWRYMEVELAETERKATDELLNCPPERVAPARERIKLARHLAGRKEEILAELARIRASEDAPEEEE